MEPIAIIPVGYADGLHRFPNNVNEVLFKGQRIPAVQRICMNQVMIRIPDTLDAATLRIDSNLIQAKPSEDALPYRVSCTFSGECA